MKVVAAAPVALQDLVLALELVEIDGGVQVCFVVIVSL
jgi:hypothetical protein